MIDCKNIDEVRAKIDIIDREIVQLMSERSKYVRQAAKFKKNIDDVKAPKSVEEFIAKVRNLAFIKRNYEKASNQKLSDSSWYE